MALATLGGVVLDCRDPHALAAFYIEVLGGTLNDEGDWLELRLPDGPTLAFQEAPDHVAPEWPSGDRSQQFHLDLTVPDLDAAETAVLALGAKPLDTEPGRNWRVYKDPAGHPFCLCRG
ncbi:VOC family protein [Streptomyces sp. NPDC059477]|uniref:VOC family protein n=1 Tax=Streptomyces sp. NPDC059477 TaxID=3346847 RepID=UPI003698EAD7